MRHLLTSLAILNQEITQQQRADTFSKRHSQNTEIIHALNYSNYTQDSTNGGIV